MALERADLGIGVQRQAGVTVPDQGVAVQGRRPKLQIVHRVPSACGELAWRRAAGGSLSRAETAAKRVRLNERRWPTGRAGRRGTTAASRAAASRATAMAAATSLSSRLDTPPDDHQEERQVEEMRDPAEQAARLVPCLGAQHARRAASRERRRARRNSTRVIVLPSTTSNRNRPHMPASQGSSRNSRPSSSVSSRPETPSSKAPGTTRPSQNVAVYHAASANARVLGAIGAQLGDEDREQAAAEQDRSHHMAKAEQRVCVHGRCPRRSRTRRQHPSAVQGAIDPLPIWRSTPTAGSSMPVDPPSESPLADGYRPGDAAGRA